MEIDAEFGEAPVIDGDIDDSAAEWKNAFKTSVNINSDSSALHTSLQSLVDARNDFAHGGNPTVTITDIINYFADSRKVIEILDSIIS